MDIPRDPKAAKRHEESQIRLLEMAKAYFWDGFEATIDRHGPDEIFRFKQQLPATDGAGLQSRSIAIRLLAADVQDYADYGATPRLKFETALKAFIVRQLALNDQHDAEWDFRGYFAKLG